MPADVVIVGGGPAGMACALRLAQLIDAHNAAHPDSQLSKENIYVLEKAREVGQHCLSGALLDPRVDARIAAGFRERCAARRRSHEGSGLLPHRKIQVQVSDHAAVSARSRQLCHLAEQVREVAGRARSKRLASPSSPDSPGRNFCSRATASLAFAPTTRASTKKDIRSRTSSRGTICRRK